MELKEVIIMDVEAVEGLAAAANLRLLSKAWRDAFNMYQGRSASITIQAKGSHHIQKVCSMLSQMQSLHILTTRVTTDFAATSSLGQLTSLRLSPENAAQNFPKPEPCLSMAILPASLKEVNLDYVKLRDTNSLHLQCLTKLSLHLTEEIGNELNFLPQLPNLEVRLSAVC